MSAVDPNQFQSVALQWIGVVSVVGGAAILAIGVLWGKVQELKDGHAENRADLRLTNEHVNRNSLAIQNTPAPVAAPPAASVTHTETDTVTAPAETPDRP